MSMLVSCTRYPLLSHTISSVIKRVTTYHVYTLEGDDEPEIKIELDPSVRF